MRSLIILLSFIFIHGNALAQSEISINASAEVMLAADKIAFQINLNADAETPQEAYNLHKKREKVLVELLKKNNIKESNINFEPITINKHYDNSYPREEKHRIQTRQQVVVTLDNFDLYEKMQITLINNDFDEFSGNFLSSKADEGDDEALKKALSLAREKADIIAEETGLTISGIKNINYSFNRRPPQPMMMEMRAKSADSNLMEFDQTVSVSANVSVTYNTE